MKKILYTLCLMAAPLFFQACDNLDLSPIDYSGSENFWQNEAQVNSFMLGLHNHLRSQFVADAFKLGETRGETLKKGTNSCGSSSSYSNLIANEISESNPQTSNWNGFYGKLLQVNHMIEQLEGACIFLDDNSRNYYKGIAYGLRSYYYFWLYRTYGGVPLELTVKVTNGSISAPDLYLKRATAEATLQQIKDDVEASLTAFGQTNKTTPSYYFWSKSASLMLKAEIYLWSAKVKTDDPETPHTPGGVADLNIAKSALSEVIGKYSLESDFSKLFKEEGKGNNNEVILALYLDKDEYVNRNHFRTFFYHMNFAGNNQVDADGNDITDPLDLKGEGLLYNEWSESFVTSFDKKDLRRAATFYEYYSKGDGTPDNPGGKHGCAMLKYFGQNVDGTHYFDPDIILYRYADAILMMAEIENGLGGDCAKYINDIRQRAYGANYDAAVTYANGTYAENELAILKERDKEFVGEGKRWFDLLRMHDANKEPLVFSVEAAYLQGDETGAILDKATESYRVLWPIERSLMSNDPELEQTVNYPTATDSAK
ncbi:RagB/SusD family nutrient uptake outer membrane protein [Bacteroides fluxus]|uniref:RagB/SusD family nutrient uptake outer membrane protein n=1 Tax=Bacteroides fluxus TaxID=626930 RepID=UPI002354D1E5|nr:RagB/SusD family nutrient uptake outer membrane protein [Bacteroides fluxus]